MEYYDRACNSDCPTNTSRDAAPTHKTNVEPALMLEARSRAEAQAAKQAREVKPKAIHLVLMELAIAALDATLPPGER